MKQGSSWEVSKANARKGACVGKPGQESATCKLLNSILYFWVSVLELKAMFDFTGAWIFTCLQINYAWVKDITESGWGWVRGKTQGYLSAFCSLWAEMRRLRQPVLAHGLHLSLWLFFCQVYPVFGDVQFTHYTGCTYSRSGQWQSEITMTLMTFDDHEVFGWNHFWSK